MRSLAWITALAITLTGATSGCSGSGSGGPSGGASAKNSAGGSANVSGGSGAQQYVTNFPLSESPISEGSKWLGGHTAGRACSGRWSFGIARYCWGDIQTVGGMAHGTDQPTQFGDPTALLVGNWGPSQTASATVKAPVPAPTGGCCMEVEVRLRSSFASGLATGYEVYCSIMSSNKYCHIASWGGPNGAYVNLDSPQWDNNNPDCPGFTVTGPKYLKNGDVLSAKVTGSNPVTITGYINSIPFVTVVDKGKCHFNSPNSGPYGPWPVGSPGIGFFGKELNTFGFIHFTASD
jgi:hypothetical protein